MDWFELIFNHITTNYQFHYFNFAHKVGQRLTARLRIVVPLGMICK